MTFEELFKQHYLYVVKYIMRNIKNQAVAEELAQEVYIQLYKTNWKEIEYIKTWLIKSAAYVTYNYIRSEKRHQARIEKASFFTEPYEIQSLDYNMISEEPTEEVRNVMQELPEQDKKLLLLRYSGLKYKEIAEVLGIDIGTVGTRIVRAQNKFKMLYKKVRR
jgi:RNA polymerase sigma factor (sigma-70 family)